jgi:hypothetical protein
MVDNIVYSSDQNRSYKIRANDNFEFLCAIRSNLNSEERERLLALSSPTAMWKFLAFDWLENKRAKYDPSYASLREKELALARATKRLQQLEQEAALLAMARLENTGISEPTHHVLESAYSYLRAQGKL